MDSIASLPEKLSSASTTTYIVLLILLALPVLHTVLHHLSTLPLHPNEPPVIPHPLLPWPGHLLSLALHGGRHLKRLALDNKNNTPIFALSILPGSPRMYIVASPPLAAAVQRASRALSFAPLVPEVTRRVLGLDERTVEIARRGVGGENGGGDDDDDDDEREERKGFLAEMQEMVSRLLGLGPYLAELSGEAVRELREEVEVFRRGLFEAGKEEKEVDFLDWVRNVVTVATARYLYGPRNPIALDPSLAKAFWDFDHGLAGLLIGVFPSITARRAYLGRERLVKALEKYLESGEHANASRIIQERVKIALRHGWTLKAVARSELSFLFAGIVNATTSTFWVLLQLYADADLLSRVRAEIEAVLESSNTEPDGAAKLSIEALKSPACPLLPAISRECLRLYSDHNSARLVTSDHHLLASQHFLPKGAIVQIAGGAMHADPSTWGPDPERFDPARFLPLPSHKQQVNPHPAAFRAFGGGKTLCPGRHFAMNEILGLVAYVVLLFDAGAPPRKGGGGGARGDDERGIRVPRKNDAVLPVHVLEPLTPVRVVLKLRAGWEERNIEVALGKHA